MATFSKIIIISTLRLMVSYAIGFDQVYNIRAEFLPLEQASDLTDSGC